MMRKCLIPLCLVVLTGCALSQQAPASPRTSDAKPIGSASDDEALKQMFESKIRTEWEALKNKDKKAYGDLLAEDYQGVEVDRRGERNKIQAINEVAEGNNFNYTLFGLKVLPLGNDATFLIYEVTLQFPPKAQVRFLRIYIGEVWVKRGGQWKLLHYQETSVK